MRLLAGTVCVVILGGAWSRGAVSTQRPGDGAEALLQTADAEFAAAWAIQAANPPVIDEPARPLGEALQTAPNRNQNPLNIKLGTATHSYLHHGRAAVSDIVPRDGGRFLKFTSPAAGFQAAAELLTSATYRHLSLDRALRRWSNEAYGGEVVARRGLNPRAPVGDLSVAELELLLETMAIVEGYRSTTMAREIATALAAWGRPARRKLLL